MAHPPDSDRHDLGIDLVWLDDSHLSPKAFRLLIHYARHGEGSGVALRQRIRDVAIDCEMTGTEVRSGERELMKRGLLEARGERDFAVTLPEARCRVRFV